ncbi:MAG: carbohydrate ABC transporter permease [Bacilli bacterium]|jgi:multiple sugar transport system permease protein|nr:carbohydrate ABC transporter permease [Bacilli bacterium]
MAQHEMYFASEKERKIWRTKFIISRVLLFTFLTLFALFILLPFWFMIVTSLKSSDAYQIEQQRKILRLFIPFNEISFLNFSKIFGTKGNFGQYFLNTAIVAIASTAFTVVTSVLAAFAFARLEFKGKNLLFTIFLATMMVPGEMMIITNYQTAISLQWANTFAALILVHGISVFYIFYLRQTFQQIPNELYLASKVDGYGEFHYLVKVMVPIAMPTIVTIIILNMMGSWNAYIWPNLIASGTNPITGQDMKLVSNGLMSLFTSEFKSEDTVKIAGSMVVTAPLLLVFIFFRKYIMRGVSRSGIKG